MGIQEVAQVLTDVCYYSVALIYKKVALLAVDIYLLEEVVSVRSYSRDFFVKEREHERTMSLNP
jgi:hypothetical protein